MTQFSDLLNGAPVLATDRLVIMRPDPINPNADPTFFYIPCDQLGAGDAQLISPVTLTGGNYNASVNNTAMTILAPHGSPGAGTGIGLNVTATNGARSAIDVSMDTSLSGGKKVLRVLNPGGSPDVPMYINARGAYLTQSWMTISGSWSGSGDSTVIEQPSTDTYMVGIWGDVDNCLVSRTANIDFTPTGSNHFLFMDSLAPDSSARYVGRVCADLSIRWQAPSTTKNLEDVILSRSTTATLKLSGNGVTPPTFLIENNGALRFRNAANSADLNTVQVNGGNDLLIGSSAHGNTVFTLGTAQSLRIFNGVQNAYIAFIDEATKKVSFGSDDTTGGYFSVYDATATTGDTTVAIRNGAARAARLRFGSNAGTFDVGLARDAAGVLAVTDSSTTLSNYRDVKARNVIISGGVTQHGSYTIATLPAAGGSTAPGGSAAYATNGRKSGEGAGAGTGIPVWCDGISWRTYYDNTVAAA